MARRDTAEILAPAPPPRSSHGYGQTIGLEEFTRISKSALADLKYLKNHGKRVAVNLCRRYQAMGPDRLAHYVINMNGAPRLNIYFMRYDTKGALKHEAVVDVTLALLKPYRGQEDEVDYGVKHRVLALDGKITRPNSDLIIPINDLRMKTAPKLSNLIFEGLTENGLILTRSNGNYFYPFGTRHLSVETPPKPLGRKATRAAQKAPILELDKTQAHFVEHKARQFKELFLRRYRELFDHAFIYLDTREQTFKLELQPKDSISARGTYDIALQGDFDLTWRNKGGQGTQINLWIRGGLSKAFNQAGNAPLPLNILRRRESCMDLYNMLVAAGRITVNEAESHMFAEINRRSKIHPKKRRGEHKAARHAEKLRLRHELNL